MLVGRLFRRTPASLRWFSAICGYICFFTGVPTLALPVGEAARPPRRCKLRVAMLLLLPLSLVLPDIIYYVLWRPEVLDLGFARRHLINPFRTLANWGFVESSQWSVVPFALGLAGLLAYLALIQLGARMTAEDAPIASPSSAIARGRTRQCRRPLLTGRAVRAAAAFRLAMPRTPIGGRIGERLGSGTGSSLEFQDYRPYAPGDDLRHVDWAAYARSELLAVRLYREEVAPRSRPGARRQPLDGRDGA